MKVKRLFTIILALVMMFSIATVAFADNTGNDVNVDSGEGHMNQTSDQQNMWGNYWQGVRLSADSKKR